MSRGRRDRSTRFSLERYFAERKKRQIGTISVSVVKMIKNGSWLRNANRGGYRLRR